MRWFLNTAIMILGCLATSCDGQGWAGKQAEVYFVVDGTSSMWSFDFRKQLRLVADIVSQMDIGPGRTRVGLGVFSDKFHEVFPLNQNYDKQTLSNKILGAPHIRGETYLSSGLQGLRNGLSPDVARTNVPRIGVFFSDGKAKDITYTLRNATQAKNKGLFMFMIGIGDKLRERELLDIASDPKRDFLFRVNGFGGLSGIKQALSDNMAKVSLYQDDKGTCGENTIVDTVFVYDEADLGGPLRKSVKKFLSEISDDLRMNPGNVRLGVVSASCVEGKNIHLGDYTTREGFQQALAEEEQKTSLDQLLEEARSNYFTTKSGHRTAAKKRIVLILHYELDSMLKQAVLGQMLRARYMDDIEVFIIRQGSDYDKEFLNQGAGSSDKVLYVNIEDAKKPFLQLFCKDI